MKVNESEIETESEIKDERRGTGERPCTNAHFLRDLLIASIHSLISSSDLQPNVITLFGITI
jgi:hypothetical protein